MRAISSFSLEAGTSTFWCRARIALRIRVSMSATGSVNFIVLLLLSHPFSPPQRRTSDGFLLSTTCHPQPLSFGGQESRPADRLARRARILPGRLCNPGYFATQRQPAEAQAANSKLAQERPRPSANLAAVVPPGRKLRLLFFFFACLLKLFFDLRVLNSLRCSHAIL